MGIFKKKKSSGDTIKTYNSGNAKLEDFKKRFFEIYDEAEADETECYRPFELSNYKRAYDIAKEWVKYEDTNRSYGSLAASAFRLGDIYKKKEYITEARDIWKMMSEYIPDYKEQVEIAEDEIRRMDSVGEEIRRILNKNTEL